MSVLIQYRIVLLRDIRVCAHTYCCCGRFSESGVGEWVPAKLIAWTGPCLTIVVNLC